MQKFIVSYSLPYQHQVSVGITAQDEADAIRTAERAFYEGTIWDDTQAMPLLQDDYEESGDAALEFEATRIEGDFERDGSVNLIRRRTKALQSCKALVAAYDEGKASGASAPWEGVDEAFELAWQALGRA